MQHNDSASLASGREIACLSIRVNPSTPWGCVLIHPGFVEIHHFVSLLAQPLYVSQEGMSEFNHIRAFKDFLLVVTTVLKPKDKGTCAILTLLDSERFLVNVG